MCKVTEFISADNKDNVLSQHYAESAAHCDSCQSHWRQSSNSNMLTIICIHSHTVALKKKKSKYNSYTLPWAVGVDMWAKPVVANADLTNVLKNIHVVHKG